MYRNYMQRGCCHSCKCSCHNEQECDKHEDIIDDTCKCVQNIVDCLDECECGFDEEDKLFPSNPSFGQSYVPWQIMDKTYTPCVGLKMGTIFPELVSPYMPGQSMREIEYIKKTNKIGMGCNKC